MVVTLDTEFIFDANSYSLALLISITVFVVSTLVIHVHNRRIRRNKLNLIPFAIASLGCVIVIALTINWNIYSMILLKA